MTQRKWRRNLSGSTFSSTIGSAGATTWIRRQDSAVFFVRGIFFLNSSDSYCTWLFTSSYSGTL